MKLIKLFFKVIKSNFFISHISSTHNHNSPNWVTAQNYYLSRGIMEFIRDGTRHYANLILRIILKIHSNWVNSTSKALDFDLFIVWVCSTLASRMYCETAMTFYTPLETWLIIYSHLQRMLMKRTESEIQFVKLLASLRIPIVFDCLKFQAASRRVWN